ncbi:MAG: hypothetical protein ACLS48_12845 [[Eubacterium] siraeum]
MAGTTYTFRIRAFNGSAYSDYTRLAATTLPSNVTSFIKKRYCFHTEFTVG